MLTGVPVVFYTVGASNPDGVDGVDGFLDVINAISAQAPGTRPNTVTTTYYGCATCGATSQRCAMRTCASARSTSLARVPLLRACGATERMRTRRSTTFIPTFPSSCSFVTSTGATQGIAAPFSPGGFGSRASTSGRARP
ncbi:hypothetical protein GGX14DRAFT_588230 [Mycena pura]|uniref:Uncharacterized protein n=1 Tax=Mycena pura TaxID=153505 RepID=A0AAD6UU29_9AGAR|nr:hypothetical protein GGX14DRAFT_588230 [Mycena pura]